MSELTLYSYYRSSAAYRVRIALNLKGIDFDQSIINLKKGDQHSSYYQNINPQGLVPSLETDQGLLTQSLAMLEWLEDTYPKPTILPGTPWQKAKLRSLAYQICCDIHPLNNLRALKYLQDEFDISDNAKSKWYQYWLVTGFKALESELNEQPFCYSDQPSIADICLIPQVFNALRFNTDMSSFPKISRIYHHCNTIAEFKAAAPGNQPDAL
ncbi:MAG: maleylacetoacetate isomerase [Endozoicomonas sp.]